MNRNPKEKPCRLYLRVSPTEKKKITELANCCGIPVAEYLRKRALGCSAFYIFNEKLSELLNRDLSPETEAAALKLFDDIYAEIIDTPKQSKREIIREILTGSPQSQLCGEKEHPRSGESFGIYDESDERSVM